MPKINQIRGRQLQAIDTSNKSRISPETIIKVMGNNPYAEGLATLGDALGRRAELRRQGEELAKLEKSYGLEPGALAGTGNTANAMTLGRHLVDERKPTIVAYVMNDGTTRNIEIPAGKKFGGSIKAPVPPGQKQTSIKALQQKGVTPEGRPVSYNPNTGQTLVDGKQYSGITLPATSGTEEQRRQALVDVGKKSIADVRGLINPKVMNELKAIRLTPGRAYSQIASAEGKEAFINLMNAVRNDLYLRTGATMNEGEAETAAISYLAALNDNPEVYNMRLDALERSITSFDQRAGMRGAAPAAAPTGQPVARYTRGPDGKLKRVP